MFPSRISTTRLEPRNHRPNQIGRPNMPPVSCRKLIQGQESLSIFPQKVGEFWIFRHVDLEESVKVLGALCFHPDVVESALTFPQEDLGQFVQQVCGLMHPKSLPLGLAMDLSQAIQ